MTQEQIQALKGAERAAQDHMAETNKRLIQLVDVFMLLRRDCDHKHPDGSSALSKTRTSQMCSICGSGVQGNIVENAGN